MVLVFTQAVSFAQTLVLARLLTPAEVGLFAAGTVLAGLLLTFSEGGLRNALVQRERRRRGRPRRPCSGPASAPACCGPAVTAASAPLVSWLFDDPTAGLITAVTAGTIVLHALTYVPDALMQRRLDVRQRLVVPPAISLGFAVTSVAVRAPRLRRLGAGDRQLRAAPGLDPGQLVARGLAAAAAPASPAGSGGS